MSKGKAPPLPGQIEALRMAQEAAREKWRLARLKKEAEKAAKTAGKPNRAGRKKGSKVRGNDAYDPDHRVRGKWGSGAIGPKKQAKLDALKAKNIEKRKQEKSERGRKSQPKTVASLKANRAAAAEKAKVEQADAKRRAFDDLKEGLSEVHNYVKKAKPGARANADNKPPTLEEIRGAELLLGSRRARESFVDFVQFMMPDPNKPDEPLASRYVVKPHHRMICEIMQEVEAGVRLRQAISMAPQFGKSEPISRLFPAWFTGRNPYRNYMFGTYSQDFANTCGGQVRAYMQSERYKLVFPGVELRKDSKAKDHMTTKEGGQLSFIGRGGAGSGKPADLFIVDDPIKDDQEAQSDTIRETNYQWFTKVAYTRCHSLSAIVIVHTRWHEDDLIGRLVDPEHPRHDKDVAAEWKTVNIPAVLTPGPVADALGVKCAPATDPAIVKAFGAGPIASLWEERFSLRHLTSAYMLNPSGFTALYLGRPTPEDGEFFKREYFRPYRPGELPANLRMYGASDHAVTAKQKNDPNVIGCVGIDENGEIWVMPDLFWGHVETDRAVEEMIAQMKRHKPSLWWAENDIIKKSVGPFLRKQMREEKVFSTHVIGMPISGDKKARARSIQGMAQLGMIHVPAFAPWWPKALSELLKFPNGTHDDVCDWLAWIGIGLDHEMNATRAETPKKPEFTSGTMGWLKKSAKAVERRSKAATARAGW